MVDTGEIDGKPADIVFCGFFAVCEQHGCINSGSAKYSFNIIDFMLTVLIFKWTYQHVIIIYTV